MSPHRVAAVFLCALACTTPGCGPAMPMLASAPPPTPALVALRQRAAANANHAGIWRELAEAELFVDGGEAQRATAALEHALRLSPRDPALHLLRAFDQGTHGQLAAALPHWLLAIDTSRTSADPMAPWIGEVALDRVGHLEGDVSGYRAALNPVMEQVLEEPGNLGAASRDIAVLSLAGFALEQGDTATAARLLREAGYVTSWRVAGPFGPYPLLTLDRRLPAEGPGPMASAYDLGPNRGRLPTRTIETDTGVAGLGGGPLRLGGGFVAEARFETASAGNHFVLVNTPNSMTVSVDGTEIGRVDARRTLEPRYHGYQVELSAGRHEIEIKLSTRHVDPSLSVMIIPPSARLRPRRGMGLPDVNSPFAAVLRSWLSMGRGHSLDARETLRRFESPHPTAPMAITRAKVAVRDPFLPNDQRQDAARRLMRLAAQRDPTALTPALSLARLESGSVERIQKMRAVVAQWPGISSLHLALAHMLSEAGFSEQALPHIERALALVEHNCGAIAAQQDYLRAESRLPEANALVESLMTCNARSYARFNQFMRQRRWQDARRELRRLAPMLQAAARRGLEFSLARATNDTARLRAMRRVDAADFPFDDALPLRRADLLLARGNRRGALSTLDQALDRAPMYMSGLSVARRALSRDSWLDRHRIDGGAVIRAFEASGRRYEDAGQVLVLDYMVLRIHSDASVTSLVHQIKRVQSEDAIRRLGQIRVPGRVLTLRTIKPDGRRLEPDRVRGMDSVPMPDLAIGDYVEYEYVTQQGPGSDGSIRATAWLFQSFRQPFDLSKLVVIAPRRLPLMLDIRGPVPRPVETREGPLRVRTWTVRHNPQLREEPNRARLDDILPWMAVGINTTWERYFETWRDTMSDRDRVDPAAQRLARRIIGSAREGSVEQRASMIHRWVTENIEPGGNFNDSAPFSLAARTGNRNRVLRYLLELAGIDAQLALTTGYGARRPSELAAEGFFTQDLVHIPRPGQAPLIISAGTRGAPFAHIPILLRGQEAILLAPGLQRVTIPDQPISRDRSIAQVDIELYPNGAARVQIVSTVYGIGAASTRLQMERVPEPELMEGLRATYGTRIVPGSRVVRLDVLNREDPEAPIVLRVALESPRLGQDLGGRLLLPSFFPNGLSRTYASLPSRNTTERVVGADSEVTIRVRSAAGPPMGPPNALLTGPHGARFQSASVRDGNTLTVRRTLTLPRMLVEPSEYAAFAQFCHAVDEVSLAEITAPIQ